MKILLNGFWKHLRLLKSSFHAFHASSFVRKGAGLIITKRNNGSCSVFPPKSSFVKAWCLWSSPVCLEKAVESLPISWIAEPEL